MSTSVSPRPLSESPTRQQLEELDELLKRMLDLPGVQEDSAAAPAPGRPSLARGQRPSEVLASRPAWPGRPSEDLAVPAADDEPPQVPEFQAPNPDDWIKLAATWQPSAQTWGPLAETWKQSARTVPPRVEPIAKEPAVPSPSSKLPAPPVPLEMPRNHPLPEAAEPQPASVPSSVLTPPNHEDVVAAEREKMLPFYLWPLVIFNKAFDAGLLLFGPLGEWLKGHKGRNLLGGIGMVCLVLGITCLAADCFGFLGDLHVWLADWFGWTR